MTACANDQFVFLHVPKTGGSWISTALERAGIRTEPLGGEYGHPALRDVEIGERFAFAFVREPLSWYRSTYAYRQTKSDWDDPNWIRDEWIKTLTFPAFLERVFDRLRPDFLGRYYRTFVGDQPGALDFIGRYERLVPDLERALGLAGVRYDVDALRTTAPENVTESLAFECPERLRWRLLEFERPTYERFYPDALQSRI
jgi:hypothetical protein